MKLLRFISAVCAVGLCGLFAGPNRAFAEATESEDVPPVEHASFHQLVFADEDLSILNNLYPPGGDSGFHSHQHDMFYVVIQPGDGTRVQKSGEALAPARKAAIGAAAFGGLGGQRLVHRVVNGDKSDAQFIVVQLHRTTPHGSRVSSREASQGYIQIVDNARLRAWRLVLEPGQSAASVSQIGKGVRIVVRGGLLRTISPGLPDQDLALRAGDFSIQSPGLSRALTNAGEETIEIVEMELK